MRQQKATGSHANHPVARALLLWCKGLAAFRSGAKMPGTVIQKCLTAVYIS